MAVLRSMDRPLYGRGSSAGLRFTACALLSIVLMYLDAHGHLAQRLRYVLQAAVYPVQVAVSSPGLAWNWLAQSFETRAALRAQNAQLQAQLRTLQVRTMHADALERENAELRGLRSALPPLVRHWQLAQIIGVETDPLRQRIIIDRGARADVRVNEAVVDGNGVLGQVARVGPWSSEVILITDPTHAIPVQVTRNSLRSIAIGSDGELLLPYLAANSDVQNGDLLVSSGLGGIFPAGLPVARVTGIRRDNGQQPAQVRALPLASVTRDHEVMLLQFEPDNPDAPVAAPELTAPAATRSAAKSGVAPAAVRAARPGAPGARGGARSPQHPRSTSVAPDDPAAARHE